MIKNLKDGWYYIYGKGSHMNIAGKVTLGVPLFPFLFIMVFTYSVFDVLFTKEVHND